MKKLSIILALCACVSAATLTDRCIALAASDLTNVNTERFGVYGAVVNGNRCNSSDFVKMAGKFACRKPVIVYQAALDSAKVIVAADTADRRPGAVMCCPFRMNGCHVWPSGKTYNVDFDLMRKDGFVPDPGL